MDDMISSNARLTPRDLESRQVSLDVLRGFALLGILAMNIQSFSMPAAAYFFPVAYGDLSGAHFLVWYLSELLARRKFMTLFSLLFGAGVILMHERAAAAGRGWAGLHYRRMGVLWLFGILHAYLLWDGDILVTYAVCGLFLFLFRRVHPGRLLLAGVISLALASGLLLLAGWSAPRWPAESLAEFRDQWQPGAEHITEEIAAMRGGWTSEISYRAPIVLMIHLFFVPFQIFWRVGGCMLLGMALYKWGWLQGQASRRHYGALVAVALLIGLPLTAYGTHLQMAARWEPVYSFFLASQFGYWGSLLMALGYLGLVMLVWKSGLWPALLRSLAAVGRMALSNYLLQSFICTSLFLGHGLGWFGSVDRVGQAGIVLAIWILQLWCSPLWLRRFRFGPAEWLWRSLSYRKRQPMRRGT